MPHDTPLLTTMAAGFAAAWVLGVAAQKLRLSPIVGYLLAGVVIGPHTPGFVGDVKLASQLAEIGVVLLMFGVGLHFHLKDLIEVKAGLLEQAGIARARYVVVTLLHSVNRAPLIAAARQLNPRCRIFVRARYLREREDLEQAGADAACFEEAEAAVALTQLVLADRGMDAAAIAAESGRVRRETLGELGAAGRDLTLP